ncbi:MmcB family DNA repair protein [Parasphingopyxis sp.]|uniref:MmcB family DNA repair protein n=1 Tax=Parasphingopyxis sp. TaxID=1920299 RepID=UPI00260A5E20|nr:MmcB family DNA repair protein [Parasphingopyxis sp.]
MADMQSIPSDTALSAGDVVRGAARLLFRHGLIAVPEVTLGNGRRADMMAVDTKGQIVIVEIKISRADLLGDRKWPDYLDYCDRFFWAVPAGFDLSLCERKELQPEVSGLIVADAYDAAIVREAAETPLAAPRRRAETLRFARRAAARLLAVEDPHIDGLD